MASPGILGLESWWSMDEAAGNRSDSHGSNTLTDNNTVGSAAGKQNNASDHVAASVEYLSHIDNASLSVGNTDFSINFWVKFDAFAATGNWLVNKRGGGADREYNILYLTASTDIFMGIWDADTTNHSHVSGKVINTGTWYWVYCEWDNTAKKIGIQIDANAISQSAAFAGTVISDTVGSFGIGTGIFAPVAALSHDGLIDEVAFYKRLLTGSERTWLYNGGAGRAYSDLTAVIPKLQKANLGKDMFDGALII